MASIENNSHSRFTPTPLIFEADVIGAQDAGLQGILVKTEKYKAGDEEKIKGRAECVVDINAAVDWILKQKF